MNKDHLLAVLERAVKTAAQAALLVLAADQVDAFAVDWLDVAGFAAGGFVLSVLTSLATSGFGSDGPAAFGPEHVGPTAHRDDRGALDLSDALTLALIVLVVVVIVVLVG